MPYANGSTAVVSPGKYNFECVTGYSRPASPVTWEFGGSVVPEHRHTTTSSGELTSYRSIIHGKEINHSDCNIRITCTATHEALLPPTMTPSVSVTVKVKGMFLSFQFEKTKLWSVMPKGTVYYGGCMSALQAKNLPTYEEIR